MSRQADYFDAPDTEIVTCPTCGDRWEPMDPDAETHCAACERRRCVACGEIADVPLLDECCGDCWYERAEEAQRVMMIALADCQRRTDVNIAALADLIGALEGR